MFQVGSLFAGIGGFCMAFAKEGFKVAWANEKDRFAIETYRRNFRGTPTYLKPVEEFSGVKEHHLCRFDEQRPHRRARGEKLYRSFYMQ